MSCKCEHCHQCEIERREENGRLEKVLYLLSIIIFIVSFFIENNIAQIILYAITIGLCGYEVLTSGIKNIFRLKFEEDTLMTIAVISAFILVEFT